MLVDKTTIKIKIPWTSQPPPGTPLRNDGIAIGLRAVLTCINGIPLEHVTNTQGTYGSGGLTKVNNTDIGLALEQPDDDDFEYVDFSLPAEQLNNLPGLTLLTYSKALTREHPATVVPFNALQGVHEFWMGWKSNEDTDFVIRTANVGRTDAIIIGGFSNTTKDATEWWGWGGTWDGLTQYARIGEQKSPSIQNAGFFTSVSSDIRWGNWNSGTYSYGGNIAITAIWDRALSDAEWKSVSENPWQIFKPRTVLVPVEVPKDPTVSHIPWTSKPPTRTQINRAHPLARDLTFFLTPWDTIKEPNLMDKSQIPTLVGAGVSIEPTDRGLAWVFAGSTALRFDPSTVSASDSEPFTFAAIGKATLDGATYMQMFAKRLGNGDRSFQYEIETVEALPPWSDRNMFRLSNSIVDAPEYNLGNWISMSCSLPPVGGIGAMYETHNNQFSTVYTGTTSTMTGVDSIPYLTVGGKLNTATSVDGAQDWTGPILAVAFWNRILTEHEHRSFHENPWQIFEPRKVFTSGTTNEKLAVF